MWYQFWDNLDAYFEANEPILPIILLATYIITFFAGSFCNSTAQVIREICESEIAYDKKLEVIYRLCVSDRRWRGYKNRVFRFKVERDIKKSFATSPPSYKFVNRIGRSK